MTLLVWPLMILILCGMYPYARWLLHRADGHAMLPTYNPILLILTTLALSTGGFSLLILAMGMIGIRFDWRLITTIYALLCAVGFLLKDRAYLLKDGATILTPPQLLQIVARTAIITIAVMCALIIFNAIYWPLGPTDGLVIYAAQGKAIASSGQLLPIELYEAYPMLVQFHYAYIFQASGWINEYLGRLVPTLLSVGSIGAAYLLGREMVNHAVGLIAALILAITPVVTQWASTGYVDLPCGFFYTMSMLFLIRLDRTQRWHDALLAGIMAGLAAWTKNSGLLIVGSIGLWFVYRLWLQWTHRLQKPIKWSFVFVVAGAFILVAAPWYIRNFALAHVIVPATGWTWKAERTLWNLFPYLIDTHYGIIGIALTIGLAYTVWRFIKTRGIELQAAFLIIFTLPFFGVWWLLFSYDSRFLLVIIAPIAVMTAMGIRDLWRRLPPIPRMTYIPYGSIFIVLLAIPAAIDAVDFKFDLLRNPLMSDTQKHNLTMQNDRYQMALKLRDLPTNARVLTQDIYLPFHADGPSLSPMLFPKSASELSQYDYWVLSGDDKEPDWFVHDRPLFTQGNYRLYPVKP